MMLSHPPQRISWIEPSFADAGVSNPRRGFPLQWHDGRGLLFSTTGSSRLDLSFSLSPQNAQQTFSGPLQRRVPEKKLKKMKKMLDKSKKSVIILKSLVY
jgi:hypothetical protein